MTIDQAIDKICQKEPLFTSMVRSLNPVEDEDTPSLGTDGESLFYNKNFLNSLTEGEVCGVLLHEILHCAFVHPWRRKDKDPMIWNMATDFAINLIVTESFPLPKGCLIDDKYAGMSADEIYEKLLKNAKKMPQSWCDKSKWGTKKRDQSQGGKLQKVFGKQESKEESETKEKEKQRKLENKWKREYEKLSKEYGSLSQSMRRMIEKDFYVPVVDWASLVATLLSEDINDYSFSHPDRRFLESEFLLPDTYSFDNLKDVIFAYDTSGSISPSDLKAFHHETLALFEAFNNIKGWTAVCDSELYSFKEVGPTASYEEINFVGGGGTDFNPVFDEVSKKSIKPRALFYFTDTYGSFPHQDPGYPVFWLVRSFVGDTEEYDVPFGQVIKFIDIRHPRG